MCPDGKLARHCSVRILRRPEQGCLQTPARAYTVVCVAGHCGNTKGFEKAEKHQVHHTASLEAVGVSVRSGHLKAPTRRMFLERT